MLVQGLSEGVVVHYRAAAETEKPPRLSPMWFMPLMHMLAIIMHCTTAIFNRLLRGLEHLVVFNLIYLVTCTHCIDFIYVIMSKSIKSHGLYILFIKFCTMYV